MSDESSPDPAADATSDIVLEALSREDGKNSIVRIYPDRIEWIKERAISSLPRGKNDPPLIPLDTVQSVKARKDGPLFSKVLLRTKEHTIVFRMHSPQAVEVRDTIASLLAGEMVAPVARRPVSPAPAPSLGPDDDQLRQLESLRNDGMLSSEEFEAAKAQLQSG